MSDFDRLRHDPLWQNVSAAILASPVARAAYEGKEPPELAPLLDKTRHHAYRILDADVEGLNSDVVIEAAPAQHSRSPSRNGPSPRRHCGEAGPGA